MGHVLSSGLVVFKLTTKVMPKIGEWWDSVRGVLAPCSLHILTICSLIFFSSLLSFHFFSAPCSYKEDRKIIHLADLFDIYICLQLAFCCRLFTDKNLSKIRLKGHSPRSLITPNRGSMIGLILLVLKIWGALFYIVWSIRWNIRKRSDIGIKHTLSEAIGSLGCRRNSSNGSVLIRQLTELQLMTSSRSVESAGISVNSVEYNRSPLSLCVSSWVNGKLPGSASFEHLNLPCI